MKKIQHIYKYLGYDVLYQFIKTQCAASGNIILIL